MPSAATLSKNKPYQAFNSRKAKIVFLNLSDPTNPSWQVVTEVKDTWPAARKELRLIAESAYPQRLPLLYVISPTLGFRFLG